MDGLEHTHDVGVDVGDLDLGDSGDPPPPVEPPEPPRRPPGPGRRPRPSTADQLLFHPLMTLAILTVMATFSGLTMLVLMIGARGDESTAAVFCIAFAFTFLAPFYLGALWFSKHHGSY